MLDQGQTEKTRSPEQQLMLLAIPGALIWTMFAAVKIQDLNSVGLRYGGVLNLAGLLLLCSCVVGGILALAVIAPLRWRAPVVVLDLSYPGYFVVAFLL